MEPANIFLIFTERLKRAGICYMGKLEYYREGHSEKHLHDISGMLEISGDIIDRGIIGEWIERLDLQKQWALVSPPTAP